MTKSQQTLGQEQGWTPASRRTKSVMVRPFASWNCHRCRTYQAAAAHQQGRACMEHPDSTAHIRQLGNEGRHPMRRSKISSFNREHMPATFAGLLHFARPKKAPFAYHIAVLLAMQQCGKYQANCE